MSLAAGACKSADSSSATPSASSSASPTAAGAANGGPKITADLCTTWAEHGAALAAAAISGATEGCEPSMRDGIRVKFQMSSLRGAANALCGTHLNEPYVAADASCFMGAQDVLAMRACGFAPMTSPTDSDWPTVLKNLTNQCAAGPQRTVIPPPAPFDPVRPRQAPAPSGSPGTPI